MPRKPNRAKSHQRVPMLGFYTYGEIGPLLGKKNTPAYFHNETMTLLVVGE